MFGFRDIFTESIGIDLGTVNTLVAVKGSGIVLREPSAVALSTGRKREVLAVGSDAVLMLGRAPGSVYVEHPLKDGVVADYYLAESMLRHFIDKSLGRRLPGVSVRAVICVPGCITDVERRAVETAAKGAGAREAYLMDEPVAAAMGAGLSVDDIMGSMVVDIGGGTTDAAVLALGGVVVSGSARAGCRHVDDAIIQYIRREHGVAIGAGSAEQIKLAIGSALPGKSGMFEVYGRNVDTGLPKTLIVSASEIYSAMKKPVAAILGVVRDTLSRTPPELAGDIMERGIVLTGGGALLDGMCDYVYQETGMKVRAADRPLDCVALGALEAVENFRLYRDSAARSAV
jgi:rod shape-determining protein MreB